VVEAGAGQGGARDGPFIGARGEGSNGARCTPVRCTAMELMVYSGGDETARRGGAVQGRDHSSEDEAVPNFPVWRVQARRRRGRWSEVTAVKPYAAREMEWLTGGVSLSAVRGRERARVSAAGGWGRLVSESERARGAGWRARGSRPEVGREGGRSREREEGGCRYGPGIDPARGKVSLFYFLFSFPISISFISFLL
jgi:hypothetical protein